eukprot:scaffold91073_cov36-Phaeocystis_antarctica.AAC.1
MEEGGADARVRVLVGGWNHLHAHALRRQELYALDAALRARARLEGQAAAGLRRAGGELRRVVRDTIAAAPARGRRRRRGKGAGRLGADEEWEEEEKGEESARSAAGEGAGGAAESAVGEGLAAVASRLSSFASETLDRWHAAAILDGRTSAAVETETAVETEALRPRPGVMEGAPAATRAAAADAMEEGLRVDAEVECTASGGGELMAEHGAYGLLMSGAAARGALWRRLLEAAPAFAPLAASLRATLERWREVQNWSLRDGDG